MALAADNAAPEATRPAPISPLTHAFVALAGAIGDGVVEVDASGIARALNEVGAGLLPLIDGRDGGIAPPIVFDALAESRERAAPVLREFVAQAPGSRHIRLAAIAQGQTRLVALRDTTEERLLQERLLQSEKMASVGQLVSGVAHELNNPLTGVMGFAQLLLARDLDETTQAQVRTIYGEAERAAKIVQNLLSFARRRKPAKELADVNSLLAQVLELRSYDFAIRNIALDMEMDPRMPRCWVDADQVQQVFFNIVKNAEQAMLEANGGGRLTVRTEGITGTAGAPTGVRISIADDGPGIPPEVQRRIFDPFFTTKEAGQGTGLGLTISYSIIDEHGGRIWAEPSPTGGARFVVELPIGSPEQRGGAAGAPEPAGTTGAAGPAAAMPSRPAYRVLVVDDEESIRLLLRDILEMDGHTVEVGSSGIEAWQLVDASAPFDVIITDMKMPGMDGATFYRELRQKDPALASRIIFITGDTVSPDTRSFLQTVSNPVLSKPFKIGPLREAMDRVTAESKAAAT
ncbi:MAG TPA: ATP-binding protein [Dehalococcoidia bacterium]|nr:ATP-binding protein [Dehalococcoidia bacterium]